MTSKRHLRFDPHALRDLAGSSVFARGEAYYRDERVEILDVTPSRVLARVAGTEDYRTVVTGQAAAIDGECSCPAFERDGFCKHMVAVALAANANAATGEAAVDGTVAQIRDYLKSKGVDALVEMVVDLAERDAATFHKLELSAAAFGADDKVLESRLRKAINDATRTRGYVDYGHAPGWAAGVATALDLLAELAGGPRAALIVGLAEHAISRIERAIEAIDDSDGHCSELLAHAQDVHLSACRAAPPDPVALARDLFRRETEGEYGTFYGAAAHYEDVLGDEGLAEYRRLTQDAWERQQAGTGVRRDADDYDADAFRLVSIVDFFAERDGDLEARVALRTRNLSSPWAYLQLAEFCLEHGREAEALQRAEEGLWLFEDERPDERLVLFAVDLLLKAQRPADAEAHLWHAFEKAPSLRIYARLRELGGAPASARAVGCLKERLAGDPPTRWHWPADLLVSILIEEKMFEAAWATVRDHGASRSAKGALAKASEATHAREAIAVYVEQVEELANTGGNLSYEQAAALIARMADLRDRAAQATYVADIKKRHGRKRNFMKLLG